MEPTGSWLLALAFLLWIKLGVYLSIAGPPKLEARVVSLHLGSGPACGLLHSVKSSLSSTLTSLEALGEVHYSKPSEP